MPEGQFKDISLSDYKGKYVVFFFYPLDSTFVCPMESIGFSDRAEEFKKLNCQVIGASADLHFCHLAWINTPKKQGGLGPVNIPLISDLKRTIAQDYGVLKANEGISFRGLFIIDDKRLQKAGEVAVIHFMSSEFDTQGKTVQKQINSWYSKAVDFISSPLHASKQPSFQLYPESQVVSSGFYNKAFAEFYQTCEDIEEEAKEEMNLVGKLHLPLGRYY
ncbi:hypothetical protein E2I00_008600 [Balaenoptera physalus]|uniref:Peroxiredoxin-1 n=1 Tax=Balaenoptera physalus TaxID=9770 RepID=A0A643BPR7_BALPH|nr:hypothetical protein E2I00_008600 [Balaenoptera physalus]